MAGSIPYIGSKISLITTSDIRYEGILYTLNRDESTIAVQNVRSFGTEGRKAPEIPMSNEIYDFIIFRGKDLKDLTVLQGAPEQRAPAATYAPTYDYTAPPAPYSHPPAQPEQPSLQLSAQATTMSSSYLRKGVEPIQSGAAAAPFRSNGYACSSASAGGMHGSAAPPTSSYSVGAGYASSPSGASGSRPLEKSAPSPFTGGMGVSDTAAALSRQSYSSAEPASNDSSYSGGPPPAAAPPQPAHRVSNLYEEANGVGSSRSPDGPGAAPSDCKDRMLDKGDKGNRGRGIRGAQKKSLSEVLRFHKRAEEVIVKMMKSQSSSNIGPSELRGISEMNSAVYHFYLDFVNFCCASHTVQTDEQQWEMLCKALKKHFEKEFGTTQSQKLPQPQRPNNTLGDYITIQTDSKQAKKGNKITRGGGRVGGRGAGRGEKKDTEGEADGDDSQSSSATWVCPRCTLRNEHSTIECNACGTSKQQAAIWAEFPPLG